MKNTKLDTLERTVTVLALTRTLPLLAAGAFALGLPLFPLAVGALLSLAGLRLIALTVDRLVTPGASGAKATRGSAAKVVFAQVVKLALIGGCAAAFAHAAPAQLVAFLIGLGSAIATILGFGALGRLDAATHSAARGLSA